MKRGGMLLAIVLATSACSTMRGVTGGLPSGKSVESVRSRGYALGPLAIGKTKDVDHNRAKGNGLVHAPAMAGYLNEVAAKLLPGSPVRAVPLRIYVLASDGFEAFSTPDANVYVSVGLLRALDSEDEVAAVLAHEASHVILGHHDSDVAEELQARILQLTALALAVHGAVNEQYGTGQGALGTHAIVTLGEAAALKLNQFVVGPAWQRGQEQDADVLGVDLLSRAGYDPLAMATVMAKQKEHEDRLPKEAASLGDAFRRLAVSTVSDTRTGFRIDQGQVNDGLKAGMGAAIEWLARSHPDTGARQKRVEEYVAREYASQPRPARLEKVWYRMTKEPTYRRICESYAKATDARRLLENNDPARAAALAEEAVGGETRDHAYPLTVLAAVRRSQRQTTQGVQALRPGFDAREPAWVVYRDAGTILLNARGANDAVAVLERGYRRLAEPVVAVPYLLRAYRAAGKKEQETSLASRCAMSHPKEAARGLCEIDEGAGEKPTTATPRAKGPTTVTSRASKATAWTADRLLKGIHLPRP